MKDAYKIWLGQQGCVSGTVQAQMHRAERVEEYFDDLDEHYDRDRLRSVVDQLRYSRADERKSKPNASKISFIGNTRNNLASYRNAVERYCKFRREARDEGAASEIHAPRTDSRANRPMIVAI